MTRRLALWLLRHRLGDDAEPFVGDLLEEYGVLRSQRSAAAARRWLLRQTVIALATLPRPHRRPATTSARGDSRMQTLLGDLRHGVRLLRRAPAFTLLAVLTLSLGVGATTAIFSVADPVLFRPLPYPDAGRLIVVGERDADGTMSNLGFLTYQDFARDARTLERAAAVGD